MLGGEPYVAAAAELVADRRRARSLCHALNAGDPVDRTQREAQLRELLHEIGEGSEILSPFQCDYGYQISIGARAFINFGAIVLDSAAVTIGDDVQIGPRVQLITPTHPLDSARRRTGLERAAPIAIDDDAWLAAGVIVLPGVTIGEACVIGAGSVVTRSMPARHLCHGSPCRPIRPIV